MVTPMSLPVIDTVFELLRQGQFTQAEYCARQLTQYDPQNTLAWKILGTLMMRDSDRASAALPILERARQLAPEDAETLNSLARAYQVLERLDDAIAVCTQAVALQPNSAEIWNNQGLIQHKLKQRDAALASYERALALKPNYVKALDNRGNVLRELDRPEEALHCHEQALDLEANNADSHNNRGVALQILKRPQDALVAFTRALAIRPNDVQIFINQVNSLIDLARFEEALVCCNAALAINPDFADAHYNRGCVMRSMKRWSEAQVCFEKTLVIDSNHVGALNNHSLLLMEQGRFDAALAGFSHASAIQPDVITTYSNALFTLNYHPDKSAAEIFAAYRAFDQRFGESCRTNWQPHTNHRDPERKLRIGYVSPDFRWHSMRHFLEPLLAHHDKQVVEITAYSQTLHEDLMTERYRHHVDHWVATEQLNDDALAERIRADEIDLLVDLAGHSAGNRLGVFARRPAPIAVSWLGYGYTTGLSAIDYFLTDEITVPTGSEELFAEQPWRIAVPSMVYRPDSEMGEVNSLPALTHGFVTFGTLTRGIRINHRTIRVWSEILQRIPRTRLVINSDAFNSLERQQALAARFAVYGITPAQLEIGFNSPPWDVLREVDIALDCFPHNSGTTLIESLYLGLPFITLADRPSVGRIGSTILYGAGHPEWIANSEDEYIEKAVALASDLPRLAAIRANLRSELEASPWRDEVGFARRVEQAYREMWRRWCAGVAH